MYVYQELSETEKRKNKAKERRATPNECSCCYVSSECPKYSSFSKHIGQVLVSLHLNFDEEEECMTLLCLILCLVKLFVLKPAESSITAIITWHQTSPDISSWRKWATGHFLARIMLISVLSSACVNSSREHSSAFCPADSLSCSTDAWSPST